MAQGIRNMALAFNPLKGCKMGSSSFNKCYRGFINVLSHSPSFVYYGKSIPIFGYIELKLISHTISIDKKFIRERGDGIMEYFFNLKKAVR